jgi:hypothetical protein
MTRLVVAFLVLALAAPAGAQQWQVARDHFAFAGRQLSVHVEADAEGTLRIIRGPAGTVRVSGQADLGMTAAGLTADERLTLTAAGEGPVDFVITVPERVWIDIHLPDRIVAEAMGNHERSRTFHWAGIPVEEMLDDDEPAAGAVAPPAAPRPGGRTGPGARPTPVGGAPAGYAPAAPAPPAIDAGQFTVFAGAVTPSHVALPDLANIRRLNVRVEGGTFRVGASRPLALSPGDPRHLEIRPGGPPMEITIVLPHGTRAFTLTAAGQPALTLQGGEIQVHCAPNVRQWLPGDRGWVTFTPFGGALDCGQAPTTLRRAVAGT